MRLLSSEERHEHTRTAEEDRTYHWPLGRGMRGVVLDSNEVGERIKVAASWTARSGHWAPVFRDARAHPSR